MIVPIPLPEAGRIVVPDELGRTDDSVFQNGGFVGRHEWEGCLNGEVYFHEGSDNGGLMVCTGCRLHLDLPRGIKNCCGLRPHLAGIEALRRRRAS